MDKEFAIARLVQECYGTGHLENLIPMLADDYYAHHSIGLADVIFGKEAASEYYIRKGKAVRKAGGRNNTMLVRISRVAICPFEWTSCDGETVLNPHFIVWGLSGQICVLVEQEVSKDEWIRFLIVPWIDNDGKLFTLFLNYPDSYELEPLEEWHRNSYSDDETVRSFLQQKDRS